MDRVSRYSYINAKLRARIGLLVSSDVIDAMIKAPNLNEAVAVLAGGPHDDLAQVWQRTGDLQQLELRLFMDEVDEHRRIIKALDGAPATFISTLLEKSEVENIKNAVRLWYSGSVMHHQLSYRAAYVCRDQIVHDIDWTRILNAMTYSDMLKAFKGTPYEEVFNEHGEEEVVNNGLFPLETGLDKLWFSRLFSAIDHLDGPDREVARRIQEVDVDLKNVLNLIRYGYLHGLKGAMLASILLPYGSLYLALERKIGQDGLDFTAARALIQRKYPEVGGLLKEMDERGTLKGAHGELAYGTLQIESWLGHKRRAEYSSILVGDPFTIGTSLSYLSLCRSQGVAIRSVLSAKYYDLGEDEIRRELD